MKNYCKSHQNKLIGEILDFSKISMHNNVSTIQLEIMSYRVKI